MNEFVMLILATGLVAAIGTLAFVLGERTEKNAVFEKKKKTADAARRLRDSLDDPNVVDRLHDRFKR